MRILLLFVLVAWYVSNVEPVANELDLSPAGNYKRSIVAFAKKSFKVIAENRTGNFIYSPVGASILLTMAAFGAEDQTAQEMRESLGLPSNDDETSDEIVTIINNLNRPQAYRARVTGKIFTPELYRPKKNFIDMTTRIFKSRTQALNFEDLADASYFVNGWSAVQTDRRVTEIVDPSMITGDTEMLLLNTGYVESNWKMRFASDRSMPCPFYVNGHEVQNVTNMMVSGYFPYGELYSFDATFVELPFADTPTGDGMSMYVILPKKRDGLPELLRYFDKLDMFLLMSARRHSINIYLPKFQFSSVLLLKKPLQSLGFGHMFQLDANFEGITENRFLRVSNVIQKAHINVYEDDDRVKPLPDNDLPKTKFLEEFRVDHPFLCVIMKDDGIPLFITVVNEPRYRAPE